MAASLAAADLGCQVTLVDAEPSPGGQVHRQGVLDAGTRLPRRFLRILDHPRVRRLPATTIWYGEQHGDGFLLRGARGEPPGRDGTVDVAARAVVLATGAAELALPFPGWDLPGVTTAGAAQALLKGQATRIGARVLVAGSGPFLLPVAATLADAGVRVVAILEATRWWPAAWRALGLARDPAKLGEAGGYLARLARHRVPVHGGLGLVACHGDGRVEQATIARLDRDWRPLRGTERRLSADAVCVSFGFVPALELPRTLGCRDQQHPSRPLATVWHDATMATSRAGVFAAGEATGVGGADLAELEGGLAGASAARYLGHVQDEAGAAPPPRLRRALARARRFATLLERLYPLPPGWLAWLRPDTVMCRCEETTWADVLGAVAEGATDVRSVKGVTRCGMGYCQGRVCGPPLQHAIATLTGQPLTVGDLHSRVIGTPVPLATIATPPGSSTPGRS